MIEEKDAKILESARRVAELQRDQEHWRDQVRVDSVTYLYFQHHFDVGISTSSLGMLRRLRMLRGRCALVCRSQHRIAYQVRICYLVRRM